MNNIELLVTVGSNRDIETIRSLFNNYRDWKITPAFNDEEAIEKFQRQNFDMVVFSATLSPDEEKKLRKIFTFQNPDIIIIKHQHGNERLLADEVVTSLEKLQKAKKPSYAFVDDALKNAGLKIIIQ